MSFNLSDIASTESASMSIQEEQRKGQAKALQVMVPLTQQNQRRALKEKQYTRRHVMKEANTIKQVVATPRKDCIQKKMHIRYSTAGL